jgi:tetratricopeptide (TPR) repeat protein
LENFGVLYLDERRYDDARALFKRASAVKEKLLGPGHLEVGESLTKLAFAELALGHDAEAELVCQRALSILENISPPGYPTLIDALKTYALVLIRTKRKEEAELLQTRAMVYRAKFERSKNQKRKEEPPHSTAAF